MRIFFFLLALSQCYILAGQQSIDGDFEFQTDPAKKYSLYIPSGYDDATPHSLMLGLHPLNVNRWDGESWRDTLITFAEANNLLLVCPDGGIDGQIDSPIDTAFTTTLIDSVSTWYNINQEEKYIMGFSWGGKTTYTYGLRRTDQFKGYLVIGAAVTLSETNGIIDNASNENFYLVHGGNDTPNVRFTPLKNALEDNDACVESILMPGVGHTIDFNNRNEILTEAFSFLRDNVCAISSVEETKTDTSIKAYPNPTNGVVNLTYIDISYYDISIYDIQGKLISHQKRGPKTIQIPDFKGLCYLHLSSALSNHIVKIIIQ